jgi:hypothetical protein
MLMRIVELFPSKFGSKLVHLMFPLINLINFKENRYFKTNVNMENCMALPNSNLRKLYHLSFHFNNMPVLCGKRLLKFS